MRRAMAQISEVPANPSKQAKAASVSKFHMFKVQGVHVQGMYMQSDGDSKRLSDDNDAGTCHTLHTAD